MGMGRGPRATQTAGRVHGCAAPGLGCARSQAAASTARIQLAAKP